MDCKERLSDAARDARNEYYKKYRVEHSADIKAYQRSYWESKAKEKYGKKYKAPRINEELSEQALEIRRQYYRDRRKANPDEGKKNRDRFFEKLAIETRKDNAHDN